MPDPHGENLARHVIELAARHQLVASLRTFLVQHCHQLVVYLVQRDLGAADERRGAELTRTATTDQHRNGGYPGESESDAAGCAAGTQDMSHGRYLLTLRGLISSYPDGSLH
jgi:hypothetical protein